MRLLIFMVMLLPCLALAGEGFDYAGAFNQLFKEAWPVLAILLLDFALEKSPLKDNTLLSLFYRPLRNYLESKKK